MTSPSIRRSSNLWIGITGAAGDAAGGEEEDEEEEDAAAQPAAESGASVAPKRADEFTCPGCFLLVNRGQFGRPGHLQCPVGEDPCPAIELIESGG